MRIASAFATEPGPRAGIMRAIHEAFACRRCGGSRAQNAVAWNGRGNFVAGGRDYAPDRFERLSAAEHCTCPGSRYWNELRAGSSPEDAAAMGRAELLWDQDGLHGRERRVRIPDGDGNLVELTPGQWREYLQAREESEAH